MTLEEIAKWIDCLEIFGASIKVWILPEDEEYRTVEKTEFFHDGEVVDLDEQSEERPALLLVKGRERVSGTILQEIDDHRDELISTFRYDPESMNTRYAAVWTAVANKLDGLPFKPENPHNDKLVNLLYSAHDRKDMWLWHKSLIMLHKSWMTAIEKAKEKGGHDRT